MYKIVEESVVVNPEHFSKTDRVESISSLGSRRKRHLVGLSSTEFFLLSCVLPIEAETGWQALPSLPATRLYAPHGCKTGETDPRAWAKTLCSTP